MTDMEDAVYRIALHAKSGTDLFDIADKQVSFTKHTSGYNCFDNSYYSIIVDNIVYKNISSYVQTVPFDTLDQKYYYLSKALLAKFLQHTFCFEMLAYTKNGKITNEKTRTLVCDIIMAVRHELCR